ncbi:class I SAM-dependent methyltransferase [Thiorhodococcus mannitoliphagus]|uniref:Class I SAM-dependent methyltransferase n=1 Tax=Thiorhodococcus mannitoliphagus TaxID=329406 RepID=A0A6P1DXM2_9GAMM|nr:class I SAM-dependent methyltransferase [Thiorhodococcus mannitoliphagus]
MQHVPGIRDVYNLAATLLTIQGRLHRLQLAIEEAQAVLKRLDYGVRDYQRLIERRCLALDRRCDVIQIDLDFGRREMELLESRLASSRPGVSPVCDADAKLDDWCLRDEGKHQGAGGDLLSSQRSYLPFIRQATPDPAAADVLDIGCGCGDWLALLKQEGFRAVGVDSNPDRVAAARRAGLQVHEADLFEYLKSIQDRALAAITAFHVVQSLPVESLPVLFAEALRVLRPDGVLILETPNPENLQVSGYSFWLDPAHVRLLPPPLLQHLVGHAGFIEQRIERVNPWPQYRPADQDRDELANRLNRLLYCGQNYALIARA